MLEDITVLRVVNGNDLFCLFNAVVDEAEVMNAREVLRRTKKFDNPILKVGTRAKPPPPSSTTSSSSQAPESAKVREVRPPPPPPSRPKSEEPVFSASKQDHDSDDEDDEALEQTHEKGINLEEIYK